MTRSTRTLADGFYFGECPRWHDGRLWFSEFYHRQVMSVSLTGDLRVEFELPAQPAGLGWLPDGSLLVVAAESRQVLRRALDGTMSVHADLPHAGFNGNDMVVDGFGRAYVGEFGFDLEAEIAGRGFASVLADHPLATLTCVLPDGTVQVVDRGMHFPNGAVVTPDGRTLIVAETLAGRLSAFDLDVNGAATNRRVWASTRPRVPDGIALNAEGEVWVANPAAPECVLLREGGEVLEVVDTGQPCFACTLGGASGRTLYMLTAPGVVTSLKAGFPQGRLLTTEVDSPRAGWP